MSPGGRARGCAGGIACTFSASSPPPPHPPSARLPTPSLTHPREDARFLYKRIPDAAKASPELQAVFGLLQRLWVKDYAAAWAALQVGMLVGWGGVG